MRALAIGLVAGACWLQTSAALPPLSLAWLMLLGALLLLPASRRLANCHAALPIAGCLLAGMLAGFAWSAILAGQRLSDSLPAELEGQDMLVVGVVDSLPQRFERGLRFQLRVESPQTIPSRLALSWYAQESGPQALPALRPGERWQFKLRLRRVHGNANPHGFDYEAWLLEQGVRATGYVREAEPGVHRRLDAFVPGVRPAVERARDHLRERMLHALAGQAYAPVLVALVIGDQRDISRDDWTVFAATGVGHLVSISGLHITMVAGLFAGLTGFLWRRSFFTAAQLPLRLPAQKAAALAGALCALLYVALSGFGVPAQRTLYMLVVVALAVWSGRATAVTQVLAAALAAVILLDPWAVLWPGFWLSFGAVAVILFASAGRVANLQTQSGWRQTLSHAARTQWAVSLGLVPLTLLLFSQISLVSPLANAVAIPVVSFVVTPLSLLGSVLPAPLHGWVLSMAHAVLALLATWLEWLAAWPWARYSAAAPNIWLFVLALAGTAWMLAPRGWPHRAAGLLLWLPLLLNPAQSPPRGMVLTAFDVGQGTAVLVETANHRLLYDTGPWYSPEADGGNRVLLPYLKGRGINWLDAMVISHNDNDHSGGALSLLREVGVGSMLSSLEWRSSIIAAASHHHRCVAGQRWEWDGVRFEMLHPDSAVYQTSGRPNTRSCTLKISTGAHAVLLPGDIEKAQETALIKSGLALGADVLLAPHHGSGTSSTPGFLAVVQPKLAIFQVGYRNRYRHPKAEVWDRYGEAGIERRRTDQTGALRLEFDQELRVWGWREQVPRYWHGR